MNKAVISILEVHAAGEAASPARSLAKEALVRLDRAPGLRLYCEEGLLWATRDGQDIILGKGESLSLAEGPVLLGALAPASYRLAS